MAGGGRRRQVGGRGGTGREEGKGLRDRGSGREGIGKGRGGSRTVGRAGRIYPMAGGYNKKRKRQPLPMTKYAIQRPCARVMRLAVSNDVQHVICQSC